MRLAGVIVLYNPDEESVIENINSYINDIEILIVVDNTDKTVVYKKLIGFLKHKKILYINNGNNLGIARALNIGAEKAIELGYKWLLTMDQDSKASEQMINNLIEVVQSVDRSVAIISPLHLLSPGEKSYYETKYIEAITVMTSGNLLNLESYFDVGSFEEKLFIDYVDHEYCLRLRKKGYKILIATKAKLEHNHGKISKSLLGSTTNHNYVRRYYITRNRLFVRKNYKHDFAFYCRGDLKQMIKEFLKICLLEKDKFKKIQAVFLGIYHFKNDRYGKL